MRQGNKTDLRMKIGNYIPWHLVTVALNCYIDHEDDQQTDRNHLDVLYEKMSQI